jgi:hypothetical protein
MAAASLSTSRDPNQSLGLDIEDADKRFQDLAVRNALVATVDLPEKHHLVALKLLSIISRSRLAGSSPPPSPWRRA